jgi:hypothetical protein
VPAPAASLEETAADRGRLRDLLTDIGELPERHRGALVMRELAGLDFEQIGAALGTSPGAARQVLYEARRSMQQMSEGREMECDAVTELLSAQDGRVARRRDVRAHLRDCFECRRFGEEIRSRRETLAGIAPLPALAAAAMAKGALGGAAGVGAGTAGGGAPGGALAVAGGAAKVASTGAILKSTAAVVAVVAVGGAVAVDVGHPFGDGAAPTSEAGRRAPNARPAGEGPDAGMSAASAARHRAASDVAAPSNAFEPGRQVEEVGLRRPVPRAERTSAASRPDARRPEPVTTASDTGRAAQPIDSSAAPATTDARPANSVADHPGHPTHPEHPAHPSHPAKAARPATPAHPAKAAHPATPAHPEHPSRLERSETAAEAGAEHKEAAAPKPEPVEAAGRPAPAETSTTAEAPEPHGESTEPPGLTKHP